jgi:hypothetical protein
MSYQTKPDSHPVPLRDQNKAALLFISYGGNKPRTLSNAICVTPKRARKLIRRAKHMSSVLATATRK